MPLLPEVWSRPRTRIPPPRRAVARSRVEYAPNLSAFSADPTGGIGEVLPNVGSDGLEARDRLWVVNAAANRKRKLPQALGAFEASPYPSRMLSAREPDRSSTLLALHDRGCSCGLKPLVSSSDLAM